MTNEDAQAASLPDATSTVDVAAPESDPLVTAIQMMAYEMFLSRGERHGDDVADWLEAERIVRLQIS